MANKGMKFGATVLAGVGALNWGLDALGYNLVTQFLAEYATTIYWVIGAAGAYLLYMTFSKGGG